MTQLYYDIWTAVTLLMIAFMVTAVNFNGWIKYLKLVFVVLIVTGSTCLAWRILGSP